MGMIITIFMVIYKNDDFERDDNVHIGHEIIAESGNFMVRGFFVAVFDLRRSAS